MQEFLASANSLPLVPLDAIAAYKLHLKSMTDSVNRALSERSDIHSLIGHNPLQMMYDNHHHHGDFMATVFAINSYSLLARTLPWVYRAYSAHNFSYDYFTHELEAWKVAIQTNLQDKASCILAVYDWMIEQHQRVIELSETEAMENPPVDESWLEDKNAFLAAALQGDHKACLKLSAEKVTKAAEIETFYLQILQPVLYEVGMLWERGEISVANEHLASAIVSRVMASVNLTADYAETSRGKAIVASPSNELHEIGAAMVSDVLEHNGWDVDYIGANIPLNELLAHMREHPPTLLALSVTIPFNLDRAKEIIDTVRTEATFAEVKIMVGGRVFNDNCDLWKNVGADGYAANLNDLRVLAESWGH